MGTILKFLLIALVVLWLLYSPAVRGKILGRPAPGKSPKPSSSAKTPPSPPSHPEGPLDTMVACAHCGVHLPAAEAVTDAQGHPFCSAGHRDRNRT